MPDIVYPKNISEEESAEKKIYLPSHYDKDYRQIATPYSFQNIDLENAKESIDAIVEQIQLSISSFKKAEKKVELQWVRIINTIDFKNEIDGVIERDIAKDYGNLIQKHFGNGNVNLLLNPEKTTELIRNQGYDVIDDVQSILYPQELLSWNSFYNRYYAVWYTPIDNNNTITSKTEAEQYIKNLAKTPSYILKDEKGIILKVTDELGFTPADIASIQTNKQTVRVKKIKALMKEWSQALNDAQIKYFKLLKLAENEELIQQYLFVDEDVNIFSNYYRSFFVFKLEEDGYYGDLHPSLTNKKPEYWDCERDYQPGDVVLGAGKKLDEGKGLKDRLYVCITGYKAGEGENADKKFHRTISINNIETKKKETVIQWHYLTNSYAKEMEAIEIALKSNGKEFNRDEWIRFVLPPLEVEKEVEYYPNGAKKPNPQEGWIAWSGQGITLRKIKHLKKKVVEGVEKTYSYYNYHSVYETDLDKSNPQDNYLFYLENDTDKIDNQIINYKNKYASPNDSNVVFYNSSKEVIHYFKKSDSSNGYVIIEAKLRHIKDEAFKNRADLQKVVLRSTITTIGNYSFSNCSNLKHCLLPSKLENLGINAFASCTSLKRASLPPGITSLYATYAGCTNLQSVVLSENCTELGDDTFRNCTNLKKIYNTNSIIKLGRSVFQNCENLLEFSVPEKVTELPFGLFKNCKNAKITINCSKIVILGESCFEGCENITETVSFKDLIKLEPRTYRDCINLKNISFDFGEKNKEKTIPERFCEGCYKLLQLDLGNTKRIEDKAFLNCAALEIVTIPTTVTYIGKEIFYDCFRLGLIKVPLHSPFDSNKSWIEVNEKKGPITSLNETNWVDRSVTTITDYDGERL